MKLRGSSEQDESVINFLKSEEFSAIIDNIVKTRISDLQQEISTLKIEVQNIRKSNIDLVKLLTNIPKNVTLFQNKEENNFCNSSNYSPEYNEKVLEKPLEDKKSVCQAETDNYKNKNKPTHTYKKEIHQTRSINKYKNENYTVIGAAIQGDQENQEEDITFEGEERKIWLHLDRCKSEVKVEHIKKYLQKKCPRERFIVESLRKSDNPSFKIGAPQHLEESLFTSSFWPKDVVIRPFKFFRPFHPSRQPHTYRYASRNSRFQRQY